jgi:glycosyltransferase involved in cell wall biosynthesis
VSEPEDRDRPSRRVRVVVVAPSPPPVHGVAMMTEPLLEGLRATDRLAAHVDSRDPRAVPSSARFDAKKALQALRLIVITVGALRRHRDAALYVPISQSRWALLRDGALLYAGRAMRRTRIVHLHGGYLATVLERDALLRRFLSSATKGDTIGWALTDRLTAQLLPLIPSPHVEVLSNAVPDPRTMISARQPDRDGRLHLAFVSNLRQGKGHDVFLSCLESMHADRGRFAVRIAGDGDERAVARVISRTSALAAAGWDIRYEGSVSAWERTRILTDADVFVMPTEYRYEGQPLVILEALAAGCAVIATSHAGIPDTITQGVEGRLVSPAPAALAEAILELAVSPRKLRESKAAARDRYDAMYSPVQFARRVQELTRALDRRVARAEIFLEVPGQNDVREPVHESCGYRV